MTDVPTKSQVNKAGKTLRRMVRTLNVDDAPAVFDAIRTLLDFRAAHQRPLISANMGLRSMTRTEGCDGVRISQRLKRVPTIIDKLRREPTLALANMQDIGGCRAVVNTIDEIRRVQARLVRRRPVVNVSDYITDPRSSGYRGLHIIVLYGDDERRIEVQLRTTTMHEWAVTVEDLSGSLGVDVKSGDGPPEVQQLLRTISAALAIEERGNVVDDALQEEIARLRALAAPYLRPGGHR